MMCSYLFRFRIISRHFTFEVVPNIYFLPPFFIFSRICNILSFNSILFKVFNVTIVAAKTFSSSMPQLLQLNIILFLPWNLLFFEGIFVNAFYLFLEHLCQCHCALVVPTQNIIFYPKLLYS